MNRKMPGRRMRELLVAAVVCAAAALVLLQPLLWLRVQARVTMDGRPVPSAGVYRKSNGDLLMRIRDGGRIEEYVLVRNVGVVLSTSQLDFTYFSRFAMCRKYEPSGVDIGCEPKTGLDDPELRVANEGVQFTTPRFRRIRIAF
ncbi:MAG: hypothetical protein ACK47B_23330 [Armatimonadota bacterium]